MQWPALNISLMFSVEHLMEQGQTKTHDFLPFTKPFIDEETIGAVVAVLRSGWLTGGPKVLEFERALSTYCAGRSVRTFNSATAALIAALRLAGVGVGDEVVTSPLTWVATANSVLEVGARPVFVDIEYHTRNIDLSGVADKLTPSTKALIPVDLAGLPVDRDKLQTLAHSHALLVIEDAAQSFGANWKGRPVGTGPNFVAFSFHANKNVTSGEGGALVLPDEVDLALCERLRLQGVTRYPDGTMDVTELGAKANMSDIAAAIGLGQLVHMENIYRQRAALACQYFATLRSDMGLELPLPDFEQSNWHMFQVLLPHGVSRASFIEAMRADGIGIGVHYSVVHLYSLYRKLGYGPGDFPVAEDVGSRIVTLPLFPGMRETDVNRVCFSIEKILLLLRK
jgi:dTDP-4-amino-4,6-dideoxygalactose transaminase